MFLTAFICSLIFILSRKYGDNSSGANAIGMFKRKTNKQVARELVTIETDIGVSKPMPTDRKYVVSPIEYIFAQLSLLAKSPQTTKLYRVKRIPQLNPFIRNEKERSSLFVNNPTITALIPYKVRLSAKGNLLPKKSATKPPNITPKTTPINCKLIKSK